MKQTDDPWPFGHPQMMEITVHYGHGTRLRAETLQRADAVPLVAKQEKMVRMEEEIG